MTAAWAGITGLVSRDQAAEAVELAAAEIAATIPARARGQCVYGWSGGKDSQALRVVAERAGIHRSVLGLIPRVEWTAYLTWIQANKPDGIIIYGNREVDLAYLAARPRLVFPRTARDGYWWTMAGTRRAQSAYQRDHSPPVQLYGRRFKDGNQIPGKFGPGLDPGKDGTVVYCPIRGWSHEMVLAVCRYYRMGLPPVYGWPHGWTAGTGAWPGRRVGTIEDSWAETYAIEPEAVIGAARFIPSAAEWLDDHAR